MDMSFPFVIPKSNSSTPKPPVNVSARPRTKQGSMPRWLYRRFFPPADPEYTMGYEVLLQQNEVDSEEKHTASAGGDKLSQDP